MGGIDLQEKRGLVVGIANAQSIACGCARAMRAAGAELAVTYLNEKAEPHVRPLAEQLQCPIVLPCDLRAEGQLEAVFAEVRRRWGRLDFLLHAVAFAPKEALYVPLVDCPRAGFLAAMEVSCYSLVQMAALAGPLMDRGGALVTLTFLGAQRVVENYNVMGPVKAALESVVRSLAVELGPRGIRVNAISPGPIATRAASGIKDFDRLRERVAARLPGGQAVGIDDVGPLAVFLASDAASRITGGVHYVDGGYNVLG